tara:strand:- start:3836 stop:4339 length:504 start_codon:yes stop_codon:yes gene_type:complete
MVLAELSLAIAAVKGVGEAIDAAKSIAEVAGQLDKALNLTDKAEKIRPKGKTEVRVNKKLEQFEDNTDGESTNLGAIIQEVSDEENLKNELYRIGTKLDVKFGPGTWDKIKEIRRKRLEKQERLEYEAEQREIARALARKKFWLEVLKVVALVASISLFTYWLSLYY